MTKKNPEKTAPKKTDSKNTTTASKDNKTTQAKPAKQNKGFPLYTLLIATTIVGATYVVTKDMSAKNAANQMQELAKNTGFPAQSDVSDDIDMSANTGLTKNELDNILSTTDNASPSTSPQAAHATPKAAAFPSTSIDDAINDDDDDIMADIEIEDDFADATAPSNKNSAQLQRKMSRLADRVKSLKSENRSLKKELRTLKNQQQDIALHAGVTGLHNAITSGNNFNDSLSQLTAIDNTPLTVSRAIAALDALPTRNVMRIEELGEKLVDTARDYQKSNPGNENLSMWDKTVYNLTSSIYVRKVGGNHEGDDDGAIIARAEAQLNAGDIDAALNEIENLSPNAADFFDNWTTMAKEHITATKAANTMLNHISKGGAS